MTQYFLIKTEDNNVKVEQIIQAIGDCLNVTADVILSRENADKDPVEITPQWEYLFRPPDDKGENGEVQFVLHFPAEFDVYPLTIHFFDPDRIKKFIDGLTGVRRLAFPHSELIKGEA